MTPAEERVIRHVRTELERLYGHRLERLILYGSRARGEARRGSDYDFVAVLDAVPDYWLEKSKLSDLRLRLLVAAGIDVSVLPLTAGELEQQSLLAHNIRVEGIAV